MRKAVVVGVQLLIMGSALAVLLACVSAVTCPAPQVITVCVPVKTWTQAEQIAVADELKTLPPGGVLPRFIQDYGAMRAAARACHGS